MISFTLYHPITSELILVTIKKSSISFGINDTLETFHYSILNKFDDYTIDDSAPFSIKSPVWALMKHPRLRELMELYGENIKKSYRGMDMKSALAYVCLYIYCEQNTTDYCPDIDIHCYNSSLNFCNKIIPVYDLRWEPYSELQVRFMNGLSGFLCDFEKEYFNVDLEAIVALHKMSQRWHDFLRSIVVYIDKSEPVNVNRLLHEDVSHSSSLKETIECLATVSTILENTHQTDNEEILFF